ncbi:non-homologous end joining protein Ku [Bdellovibrio reynosensis]|uniref:Non-homologous end joining protein Ku n=1 Tax=Bdellovibrio reynosensis TaxID=2835041 RepID=A0ABY4C5C5_9BACT|nr:Ku protein [Bdellovibrio reynosensis]UOF00090.1 Ku protein [Bdellovibrio reynosensis]
MRSNIWKGSISFGLLNIPVSLQSAQQSKDLSFSMLDEKDLAHIKYKKINAKTGKEVPYDRIVKGFQYKPGQFVIMEDKDFERANVKATKTIDIEDFVPQEDLDTMLFEKPYYLAPQKGAEKGYFLLKQALENTGKVAIAKIVIRTKQHLCMIMPKSDYLILEILRFAHEVKEIDEVNYLEEVNPNVKFSDRELKMAEDLIKGMSAKWKPEKYKDTFYDDIMKRIEAKVKAGKGKFVEEPVKEERVEESSNVVDLLPLLRKSLEAKGKKTKEPKEEKIPKMSRPPTKKAANGRSASRRHH